MKPVNFRSGRMLQRNSAPMPLNLDNTPATTSQDDIGPMSMQPQIHDIPVAKPSSQQGKINHPLFSSNFNFAGAGAAPSPPPSAGLPHARHRERGPRSKSPSSARSSMLVEDEEIPWDTSKLLPQFQQTLRRPSLLTPPTTSDSRRQSYDRSTHLGYDDGSTELLPPGRRSSVPTHHLRPDQSSDHKVHSGFRRSSLATTSMTRQEMEDPTEIDVLSEVDSAEEELAADNSDIENVQAQTADLKLDDTTKPAPSLKRESASQDDAEPNIHSAPNTPIPNPFATLNNVPRPYVLKRLLDLGPYFVGHESTAQVFVEAIPMTEKNPLYKVEVVPRNHDSEPFRIVKRHKYDSSDSESTPPPESPPCETFNDDDIEYTSPALPIHVEYAVFRLPLLGSMLLSGQVFCGDTLKMPLPYPEVWTSVVGWMYTNKVVRLPGLNVHDQAEMVRDCIVFLGGRV